MTPFIVECALVALIAGYSAWLVGINCRALWHPHPHGLRSRRRDGEVSWPADSRK